MIREAFRKLKEGTEYLNYGRHIIRSWGAAHLVRNLDRTDRQSVVRRVLDIGCGHGKDLLNIKDDVFSRISAERITVELAGIENFEDYANECRERGIRVFSIDIEHDEFPGEEGTYDLVIANQVLEHTKEIFWIFEEVTRVLKPGGRFIVGVPNIASLHNRLLLLFGKQPTTQQTLSAHVRSFSRDDFSRFARQGDFFELIDFQGSNFYPFSPILSKPLSRFFPGAAWGIFFLLERTERTGSFLECLSGAEHFLETPFYGSPQNPAHRKWKLFGFRND